MVKNSSNRKKKLPKSKAKKIRGGKNDPKVTRSCCSFKKPGGVLA